ADAKISSLQSMFDQLPEAARQHSTLKQKFDSVKADRKALAEESDADLAMDIASIRADEAELDSGPTTIAKSTPTNNRAVAGVALSDEQVDQLRSKLIGELNKDLAEARKRITNLPRDSDARNQLANQIRDLSTTIDKLKTASRDTVREIIAQAKQEAEQEAAAQRAQKEENQRRFEAKRQA